MLRPVVAFLVIVLSGCASAPGAQLKVSQVLSAPGKFDGGKVIVCGWFVADMETCTLQDRPPTGYSLSVDNVIWVTPSADVCVPIRAFSEPKAGWARVDGTFRAGTGVGHLGQFRYALLGGTVASTSGCE